MDRETFRLAQQRLDQNKQMAPRNNTAHDYLLRGLVSCAQCQLSCMGRMVRPGYAYYLCRGRTDGLRAAKGERCTARYAPAQALDDLVRQDLCQILTDPALITHELERAQAGEWLPQALQSRRQTLQQTLAHLERQQARLLDAWGMQRPILEACNYWYSGAYLLETWPSVLYILMHHAGDPEQAIIRAVNDTKDNDTVAAIVVSLHGAGALPVRWRDQLLGRTGADDDGTVFALIEQARHRWFDDSQR